MILILAAVNRAKINMGVQVSLRNIARGYFPRIAGPCSSSVFSFGDISSLVPSMAVPVYLSPNSGRLALSSQTCQHTWSVSSPKPL